MVTITRKPFVLSAMIFMVGYSVLNIFLSVTMLEQHQYGVRMGGTDGTGAVLSRHFHRHHYSHNKIYNSNNNKNSSNSSSSSSNNNHHAQSSHLPEVLVVSLPVVPVPDGTIHPPDNKTTTAMEDNTTSRPSPPILAMTMTTTTTVNTTTTNDSSNNNENNDSIRTKNLDNHDKSATITVNIHTSTTTTPPLSNDAPHQRRRRRRRFPSYGTPAFEETCPWIPNYNNNNNNHTNHHHRNDNPPPPCTILARPAPEGGEGISNWVAQITGGFIMAQQAGCKFMLDYGTDIQIDTILEPAVVAVSSSTTTISTSTIDLDWRVPPNFDCEKDPTCFIAEQQYNPQNQWTMTAIEKVLHQQQQQEGGSEGPPPPKLAYIPSYRHPYSTSEDYFETRMGGFRDLTRTLPGFTMETGMACSLGALFRLSSRAATLYQPDLFTSLLPALQPSSSSSLSSEAQQPPNNGKDQDTNPFVISLYIRTGRTENLSFHEATHTYMKLATPIIECALGMETAAMMTTINATTVTSELPPSPSSPPYTRIVWMVVTDSHFLKTWIRDKYDTTITTTTTTTNTTVTTSNTSATSGPLPREIRTTTSRGAHTKPSAHPSTTDFAEAILDWYLIGESDYVIADYTGPSFGDTAAFRTVRPYIKIPRLLGPAGRRCTVATPVLKWNR